MRESNRVIKQFRQGDVASLWGSDLFYYDWVTLAVAVLMAASVCLGDGETSINRMVERDSNNIRDVPWELVTQQGVASETEMSDRSLKTGVVDGLACSGVLKGRMPNTYGEHIAYCPCRLIKPIKFD